MTSQKADRIAAVLAMLNEAMTDDDGRTCVICGEDCTEGCGVGRECWGQDIFDQIPAYIHTRMTNFQVALEQKRAVPA